jgi:hypothetical protein
VSARRGNETHLQWRGFLFRNEYVRTPRLAYASRSSCTVPADRKITTLAVHKRTFSESGGRQPAVVRETNAVRSESNVLRRPATGQLRAAGASPPWVDKIASAYTTAIRRRTADGGCADCPCIRVSRRHGGLTPPALVLRANVCRRNCDLCDARTLVYKSGGCQPAVGTKRICNGAGFFSGTSTFAHHGWLTPAAPVVRCNFGGGCPAGQNE